MADRLERLVNLTATLLDTRRPLTLEEIADRLEPGYPSDIVARRRQFERDKETLRDLGIPIRVEAADALGAEHAYRIHPEDYYLPDLDLTAAELAALHVAVTAIRLEGADGREALYKLGGLEGEGVETAFAELPLNPTLTRLFEATRMRAVVGFGYRGQPRRLEPYGVVLRWGHWYVVGRDLDRDGPRAFRVDRIDGEVETGDRGGFEPPHDLDPAELLRGDPLDFGEDQPVTVCVLVDAPRAGWVVEQLGDDAVDERRPDGSVVVHLDVVNRAAFRAWVLELLDHAEVLGPAELRADVVAWLDAIVGAAQARP